MIQVRKSADRGFVDHGWLISKHTFSFADYHDKNHMGFSVLRVINEDEIQGGTGFEMHGHRDMEIISYVVEGALEHKDSMGTNAIIRPGEVQRMSAGTGVRHSEHNYLKDRPTHLLQIWILPEKTGIKPSYDQKSFASEFSSGDLLLVASRSGRGNSITLNQNVDIYAAKTKANGARTLAVSKSRSIWAQVVKGRVTANGTTLETGDGAGLTGIEHLTLEWTKDAEFIVFNLP